MKDRPDSPPTARSRQGLLAWYDRHRRDLPWRAVAGERSDPYRVWLSEIMLQQTTVATVRPYFTAFIARWPRIEDLAAAALDDVLVAWQGLGYYARARNLHACARVVAEVHGGHFPDTEEQLRSLPGIGDYTAAAIAAIAFDRQTIAVDGNVVRVLARLHAIETPLPAAKAIIARLAQQLAPSNRSGDVTQALMDLGATICTPRNPDCGSCPWSVDCLSCGERRPEYFPVRAARKARPIRHGVAFWCRHPNGAVLLRRRPNSGLLGGMMEIPSTAWREAPWSQSEAIAVAPIQGHWRQFPGMVSHTFTHFLLELEILAATVTESMTDSVWCQPNRFGDYALPTVMKKIARHALASEQ